MKIPMTSEGIDRLDSELNELIVVKRREVSAAIGEARLVGGEISENIEYSMAKDLQAQIEAKIEQLSELRLKVDLMNIAHMKDDIVNICSYVTMVDDSDEEKTYRMVCEYEASIENGYLSITSPLGIALMGKEVGDDIEVVAPNGDKYYNITKISNNP